MPPLSLLQVCTITPELSPKLLPHLHTPGKVSAWGIRCPPEPGMLHTKNADLARKESDEKYIHVTSFVALTGVFLAVSVRKHVGGKVVSRELSSFLKKDTRQTLW